MGKICRPTSSEAIISVSFRVLISPKNGLKARQPEFLSLPEIVSVIDSLQDLADARLKVAWLAWGGDWLPGTMIEQCLSQLPIPATNDSALPPPTPPTPSTRTSLQEVAALPRMTVLAAAMPAPVSVADHDLEPDEEIDATVRVKRTTPNIVTLSFTCLAVFP